MEKMIFCLFVPVRQEGYRILRKRYVVEGGIFDLADNILGQRGKVYLFDREIKVTCDGDTVSLPMLEAGAVVITGEPAEEVFGERCDLPCGDVMRVTDVTRKALGSPRMHHTVLTLK